MSIKWHKQLNHGKLLPLNVATISKYGIHFGSEFVKNYKIHNYKYACVGITEDNHIAIKFMEVPVGIGYNYKICFNKGAHSQGCFVACKSFIRDLPFDIYNTLMRVEVNVLTGMIFELKFIKEE